MTDDLEDRLSEALEQRGRVDAVEVHRVLDSVVLPGRRAVSGGLARLVAVVLVGGLAVGALAVGLSNRGGAAPSASSPPLQTTGPVTATKSDGTFSLTVTAAKATYRAGDAISVKATLAYFGSPSSIALWTADPPVVFYVKNDDGLTAGGGQRMICMSTDYVAGKAVEYPYSKTGGFYPEESGAAFIEDYLHDPLLHLPAGTWHVHAALSGSLGQCGPTTTSLDASVTVVVDGALGLATNGPTDSPAAATSDPASPVSHGAMPDPSALVSDPRYRDCTSSNMPAVLSAFEVAHARDLDAYLPAMALAPAIQTADPALVVVFGGPVHTIVPGASPGTIGDPDATLAPGHYDICVVIGSATAIHDYAYYSAVSFLDFDPSPSGLPALK